MFTNLLIKPSIAVKSKLTLLLFALSSLSTFAQTATPTEDEHKQSALVAYGETHPVVFIIAILIGVAILVTITAILMKRSNKKLEQKQMNRGEFSRPAQKLGRGDERRYGTRKNMPQSGGFTRR